MHSKQSIIRKRDETIATRIALIENELHDVYSHISHNIKIESIRNSTIAFCAIIKTTIEYDNFVDVLIVDFNDEISTSRLFKTFDVVHEMNDSHE